MRWPIAIVAAALVLAGCQSDGGDRDERAETTTTAPSASTTRQPDGDEACTGIGAAPAANEPVLTWVTGTQVRGEGGCLVELDDAPRSLEWGGAGDRLLVDGRLVVRDGAPKPVSVRGSWSRPTGKRVLGVDGGGLLRKVDVETDQLTPLPFVSDVTAAIYHPAGRSIVAAGRDATGGEGVFIADNEGEGTQLLVGGHVTVREFAWTASGALLFVADHDGRSHLHRLEIGEGDVTTVLETPLTNGGIRNLAASPYEGGGVAVTTGACSLWVSRDAKVLDTKAMTGRAVGWLPGGVLAAIGACDAPGDLVTVPVSGDALGTPVKVASEVTTAAVRAILPTAPAPPPVIPDAAPA